jgi:hypothetical protein
LPKLIFEQDRRLMMGSCFNCGGNRHGADQCTSPLAGAAYKCNRCCKEILITARGQSVSRPQTQTRSLPQPTLPEMLPRACGRKRAAERGGPTSKRPRGTAQRARRVLKICGKYYSPLSWLLGVKNPSPSLTRRAKEHCSDRAIELDGGHVRALQGYAGTAKEELQSVSGNRERLGTVFVNSVVPKVRFRRVVAGNIARRLSQVLFLLGDLEKGVRVKRPAFCCMSHSGTYRDSAAISEAEAQ